MLRKHLLLALALGLLVGLVGARAPTPASADTGVTFTVALKSVYLRAQPSFGAARAYSVFQDQRFAVVGRTADSLWVQLDFAGASAGAPWIFTNFGRVQGSLATVPVVFAAVDNSQPAATPAPPDGGGGGGGVSAGGGSGPVKYTVTVKSMFGRSGPDVHTGRVASLFEKQVYPVSGRNAASNWLLLAVGGNAQAWVPAAFGKVTGQVSSVPVSDGSVPAATPAAPPVSGASLPSVSARARSIYQKGLALGNDPRAFSKIGDCQSVGPFFLAPFDKGEYRLGSTYAYLQATIDNFAGSFDRDGAAAHDGLNTASIFDSIWADPTLCADDESPLACEVRIHKPSIAIISLGTNGSWQTNAEYESNTRRLLDYLIARGVLPILSTKADNLEGSDRFNQIILELADEYQLPLWNFAATVRALPGSGLADTYHLTWGAANFDTNAPPQRGWQLRNLTALQALDTVWRGVR